MAIVQNFNKVYKDVFTTNSRYIHLWGGRSRGGSHFATEYFIHLLTQPYYFRGFIMREVFSDIRASLYQDLKDRLEDNLTIPEHRVRETDGVMSMEDVVTGNTIKAKGFKKSSKGQTAKLKSIAGATHIIIEEAEEISEEDFRQLDDSLRTVKSDIKIILLFNPPNKNHWIIRRWYNLSEHPDERYKGYYIATAKEDPNLLSIHSTYESNRKNLNETTLHNYDVVYKEEFFKTGNEYYAINVKGLVSEGKKGRVFAGQDWTHIKKMPNQYPKEYGLDFGFGGDPLALIEKEGHNNKRWYKELIYETGLTNPQLSKRMDALGIKRSATIIADNADAKSIQELKDLGWNVIGAKKGPGSVNAGINKLRSFDIYVTEDSKNIWLENEEYVWHLDRNKMPTNTPEDRMNHAIDAMRYIEDKRGNFRVL